jgi:hypothetical protein
MRTVFCIKLPVWRFKTECSLLPETSCVTDSSDFARRAAFAVGAFLFYRDRFKNRQYLIM